MNFFDSIRKSFSNKISKTIIFISPIIIGLVRLTFQQDQIDDGINGIGDLISIAVYVYFAGTLLSVIIGTLAMLISFKILGIDINNSVFSDDAWVVVFITIAITSIVFWLVKIGFI